MVKKTGKAKWQGVAVMTMATVFLGCKSRL
jgi:hypothetical protein